MKQAISFNIGMVALLFFARVAAADLIGVNDPSIVGNGMPSLDGNNLTRDTESGLDWLDVTLSLGRSYNDVSTQFGAGGDYEGFRFATGPDLETLFTNAGLTLDDPGPVSQPILDFIDLFGSAPFGQVLGVSARYDDTVDGVDPALVGTGCVAHPSCRAPDQPPRLVVIQPDHSTGPFGPQGDPSSTQETFLGAMLVRPIPEPSSLILCCIGGGLVFSHVRRRHKASHSI